jgi:hypothetical protein
MTTSAGKGMLMEDDRFDLLLRRLEAIERRLDMVEDRIDSRGAVLRRGVDGIRSDLVRVALAVGTET